MDRLTKWFSTLPKGLPRKPKALERLLDTLGHPEEAFLSYHVTGTNGKGLTAAYLASLLAPAGSTGLFTSPHLERFAERIRVSGEEIPEAVLLEHLRKIRRLGPELNPFETATALAFAVFAAEKVQFAVIEVGAGGASDPTNLLSRPEAAVITSLSADHLDRFGPTLADLAREKAGILKPGRPAVLGGIPVPEVRIFQQRAAELGCRIFQAGVDFRLHRVRLSRGGTLFDWETPGVLLRDLSLGLPGLGAVRSASLALAALALTGRLPPEEDLRRILAKTVLPGRMEFHPGPPPLLLDGAHNPAATRLLARSVRRIFPAGYHLLAAGSRPPEELLAPLLPAALSVTLTLVSGAEDLSWRNFADSHGADFHRDPLSAWQSLEEKPSREPRLVTGSFYLVGSIRSLIS